MQQSGEGRVVLVLGGVRSGKSRFAQQLAEAAGTDVTFIATARRGGDAEMSAKIDRHIADRPSRWRTVEEPCNLGPSLAQAAAPTVLIDCLTLFAANILEDPAARVDQLCQALSQSASLVILVSNEVGSGVVPAYAAGRQFRDLLGEINQRVAALAGTVVLMVAGLPLPLKGSL